MEEKWTTAETQLPLRMLPPQGLTWKTQIVDSAAPQTISKEAVLIDFRYSDYYHHQEQHVTDSTGY